MYKKIKKVLIPVTLLLLVLLVTALIGGTLFFGKNTQNGPTKLMIPQGADFEQMMDSLRHHKLLINENSFMKVAQWMKFKTPKPGKYTIDSGLNNMQLVRLLRTGYHIPVKFTFHNIRTMDIFVEKVGNKFLFEPEELTCLLNNELYLSKFGFNRHTLPAMFIPNTYEFYYDISADDFLKKMYHFYKEFWNEHRRLLAEKDGFTPVEIAIIASIVEEESSLQEEYPVIAGLYINRLKSGMLLQADPTVKYAHGDFTLKRILNEHLTIDSPYNTYKYAGLPPGPIRIASTVAIDAVLNYQKHNYLYMCAKEDFSGRHNFAVTHAEHERNAIKYHKALNKRGIR
jgi:UPF0755 protein